MLTDVYRYFGLILVFNVVDLAGLFLRTKHTPASFDRISLAAALLTILWAIRDGQRKEHPRNAD